MMAHMNQGPGSSPNRATPPIPAKITNLTIRTALNRASDNDNTENGNL